jgi:hypothetical protein
MTPEQIVANRRWNQRRSDWCGRRQRNCVRSFPGWGSRAARRSTSRDKDKRWARVVGETGLYILPMLQVLPEFEQAWLSKRLIEAMTARPVMYSEALEAVIAEAKVK